MSTLNVKIERLQWGQPRPYADTIRECRLTFTQDRHDNPDPSAAIWTPKEESVEAILGVVYGPYKKKDDERGWWEPVMTTFEKEQPNVWHAIVVTASTD